jgi:hypothetical protein
MINRGVIGVALLCVVASAVTGAVSGGLAARRLDQATRGVVTTRELIVVDDSGTSRAVIGTDEYGDVTLRLKGSSNGAELLLGVIKRPSEDMAHLRSNGEDEQQWTPIMKLNEMHGRTTFRLSTVGHGNSVLRFIGNDASGGVDLGYIGDGSDDGTFGAIWGMRAARDETTTGIGVPASAPSQRPSLPPSGSVKSRK